MPTCTGCYPTINDNRAINIAFPIPFPVNIFTGYITGNGNGALSAITGVRLGNMIYATNNNINGKCTGYSGSFQLAAAQTGGSGVFSWNGSTYTCTGMNSCTTHVFGTFTPDNYTVSQILGSQFSGLYSVYSTLGSYAQFPFNQSTLRISFDHYETVPCGFTHGLYSEVSYFDPQISGFLYAYWVTEIGCTPCLTGA